MNDAFFEIDFFLTQFCVLGGGGGAICCLASPEPFYLIHLVEDAGPPETQKDAAEEDVGMLAERTKAVIGTH